MIHQIQPFIDKRDEREVVQTIKSTWVTEGPKTFQFENMIKKLTGAKYAVAFCNGTMSLFAALKALGIRRGDEVIVPNITFIASVNAIIMAGGVPVVVDVDDTVCINPSRIKEAVTPRTRAVMPVHLYGQAADVSSILKIAKKYKLYVIEDAAQGIGVTFNKKHVGTQGDLGSLSFYGNKTITSAEGGMILAKNKKLRDKCYMLKNHGRKKKGVFIHKIIGYNFCITDLQSALGVSQLNKLKEVKKKKEHIFKTYKKFLKNIREIKFPYYDKRCSPVYWFTNILVDNAAKLEKFLAKCDIETRRCFYPINRQKCYKGYKGIRFAQNLGKSIEIYRSFLSLPSYASIRDRDIEKVCSSIKLFFRKKM